jgi:hypothetical protein
VGSGDELIHAVSYQTNLIAAAIARKQITQSRIGPEAPLSLNPAVSISVGPDVCLSVATRKKLAIAAPGNPAIAAKWSRIKSRKRVKDPISDNAVTA